MFHRHDWYLLDKTVKPATQTGRLPKLTAEGEDPVSIIHALLYPYVEHVVYVFKCDCGKVKVEER